jgi:tetratricopeptide (TPR) repeat protein
VKKERVFKITAIMLPVVFILLLEAMLRIFGFGNDSSLFVQDNNNLHLIYINDKVSLRYFIREKNATRGIIEPFLKKKPENLIRIFVQGESTAAGFPYFHFGAFPQMLEYQLREDFPDKNMEIINLSMTALNSYALYDFANEIIEQKPDAVIINAGQNEYYGALGIGSTGTFGNNIQINKAGIWLRKTKTGQLISRIINAASSEAKNLEYDQTLMKRMVKTQEIPFASNMYKTGIRQYEINLDKTLSKYHKAGIKVFITNTVCNLKDLKPFISIENNNDSINADLYYNRALKLYANADYKGAKQNFIKAKELDALRFRAPEAINDITEKLAEKYDNVHFVDIRKEFESKTPDGIIGNELLLEHVHPNLDGHFLISQALINSFKENLFLYDEKTAPRQFIKQSDLPLNDFDVHTGIISNLLLQEGWPFNKTIPPDDGHEKSLEEALAGAYSVHTMTWKNAMARLMEHYLEQKELDKAVKVGEAFLYENHYDYKAFELLINLCIDAKEYEKGIRYANCALKLNNTYICNKQLAILHMKTDKPELAVPHIDRLIALNDERIDFKPMKKIALQIIIYKKQLGKNKTDVERINKEIAALYAMIGNDEAALKYKK